MPNFEATRTEKLLSVFYYIGHIVSDLFTARGLPIPGFFLTQFFTGEAGDRFPSLDMVLKLSSALNTTPDHLLLSSSVLGQNKSSGVLDLLSDCTPTEFIILYENMASLKKLLRDHV